MADQPESRGLSGQAQAAIVAGVFGLLTVVLSQWDKMPWNAEKPVQSGTRQAEIASNSAQVAENAIKPVPGQADRAETPVQAAAAPASSAPPTGKIALVNANSDLCLSPAGGGRNPNDQIVQDSCGGDPGRYWRFIAVDGNVVKIRNIDNGLCLTIAGGSPDRNIAAVQYHCDDDPSRRWKYEVVNATRYRLRNVHSDLCLTIAGGATDPNLVAVQYLCDDDPSRAWEIPR